MLKSADEAIDRGVGRRIARLRDRAGLTQAQLAERIGVEPATVGRYEAGKLRAPTRRIQEMAAALGVRTEDLLRDPPKDPSHGAAVDRALLFMGTLTTEEIELVLDTGALVVKALRRAKVGGEPPRK